MNHSQVTNFLNPGARSRSNWGGRLAAAVLAISLPSTVNAAPAPLDYKVQLDIVKEGLDGEYCWFHPYAATIPGPKPTVVLTMQKLWLPESDSYLPVNSLFTTDLGKTWSPPVEQTDTLGREKRPDGTSQVIADFVPKWHAGSKQILSTGQIMLYTPGNKIILNQPRFPIWTAYDAGTTRWSKWTALPLPPNDPNYWLASAGCTQRADLANGDILQPIYHRSETSKFFSVTVIRYQWKDGGLKAIEHGNDLTVAVDRGLFEPSLTRYGGKFYLTLRNDRAAYFAISEDGLHFSEPKKWTFEDGAELGSDNTQTHWVNHSKALFLTYTRRGADNDAVFRHRAPLFIAQVDPERMVVLRATEKILVPNKGAQLGNFAVVDVNSNETWVTTSEGMAPGHPEKTGANGRVYAARLLWSEPNQALGTH